MRSLAARPVSVQRWQQKLRARGDAVIVVDIHQADIVADLSTTGRPTGGCFRVARTAPDGLDGFIPCAGLGPSVQPPERIARVNFFGAVSLTEGLKSLLAKRRGAVVVISSNSAALPGQNKAYVRALLDGNEPEACRLIATENGQTAYGGSKQALAIWMRRRAPGYMQEACA